MSGLIVCLLGVGAILGISEILWQKKILKGENQRKFVHIAGGCFAAFWPWLISWRAIQVLGVVLLAGVLANRYRKFSHFQDGTRRESYGDIFSALAIVACASLTTEPVFFAIAILHLALADGLAAVVGTGYGKKWRYKVFGHTKTVIGSMTFWFVSLCIIGCGVLFASDILAYTNYALLLVALPPILATLENLAILGSDNIVIPVAVIFTLNTLSGA